MRAMSEPAQPTWGGRFREPPAERMQRFGESVSFDAVLAPYDIRASRAHVRMLQRCGWIPAEEAEAIDAGLEAILAEIEAGRFVWDPALEDVHMNLEHALSRRVEAGARLQTARSRNDQVATCMRLYLRDACEEVAATLADCLESLHTLAAANRGVLLPAYTHLQRGQPVSAAHHLLAYGEMLARDLGRFRGLRASVNVCPLGSGALAGTTLPIDREGVARELGFVDEAGNPRLTQNSLDAVSDRDSFHEFASAAALAGLHLSRIAEDFILWSTREFGFLHLPEGYTTGSSLMPQKRNPDALELIRGKAARLQGNLQTLQALVKNLPLTYNRDLQEDKPPLFDSHRVLVDCLRVLADLLPGVRFREEACRAAVADPLLLATDLADHLVRAGVPFRQAHHEVGALVAAAEEEDCPLPELSTARARQAAPSLPGDWREVFDLERALAARGEIGMPGPGPVDHALATARARWGLAGETAGGREGM